MANTVPINDPPLADDAYDEFLMYNTKKPSDNAKRRFVRAAKAQGDNIPTDRISNLTFNRYFDIVSIAGKAMGIDMDNLSIRRQFKLFGSLAVLLNCREADLDSPDTFNNFVENVRSAGGYPWHIFNDYVGSGITLMPIKDDNGYYFALNAEIGFNNNVLVNSYLAFQKHNIPIFLCEAKKTSNEVRKKLLFPDNFGD